MNLRFDPTWPNLVEVAIEIDDIVQLHLIPCRWKRIAPFPVPLGTGIGLVTDRIEVPEDAPIADRWPADWGGAVRILGAENAPTGLKLAFATREDSGLPTGHIRAWLGRPAD